MAKIQNSVVDFESIKLAPEHPDIDPEDAGVLQVRISSQRPLTAGLIFSRYHWEEPFHKNIGSGRMQQEIFTLLKDLGFHAYFAGQEDSELPSEILNADLIISTALGLQKVPKESKALKLLLTCNTHVYEKLLRTLDSLARWGVSREDIPNSKVNVEAYEKADLLLIAENESGISNFLHHGIPARKIRRYRNAVDPEVWIPAQKKRDIFSYVFFGSPWLRKGLPAVLQAWKQWFKGQNAELHICGAPTVVSKALLKEHTSGSPCPGMHLHIQEYPAQSSDLIQLMGESHVAVFPTLEDAQPSALLEQASCGMAIITTHESGVEFTTDFCAYVKPDNPESLEEALEYWYELQDEAREAGLRARAHILKQHQFQHVRSRLRHIILEAWQVKESGKE